jgi:hypothetical protein
MIQAPEHLKIITKSLYKGTLLFLIEVCGIDQLMTLTALLGLYHKNFLGSNKLRTVISWIMCHC